MRLTVEHLPKARDAPPVWLWSAKTGATFDDVDRSWQAFLRRFDMEHTFRFAKQTNSGSHVPSPQTSAGPGRNPPPRTGSPRPGSAGGSGISTHTSPARPVFPTPRGACPGRPPGTKNNHRAPRHDFGKTLKRSETLKVIGRPSRSWWIEKQAQSGTGEGAQVFVETVRMGREQPVARALVHVECCSRNHGGRATSREVERGGGVGGAVHDEDRSVDLRQLRYEVQ